MALEVLAPRTVPSAGVADAAFTPTLVATPAAAADNATAAISRFVVLRMRRGPPPAVPRLGVARQVPSLTSEKVAGPGEYGGFRVGGRSVAVRPGVRHRGGF